MSFDEIKKHLHRTLTEQRFEHSLGAYEAAEELCDFFEISSEKCLLAALLHDCAKCIPNETLMGIIKENQIDVTAMELENPKTLHAPVGAHLARVQFSIGDEQILNSIRYHTIGRVGMDMVEKVVFLADKIEKRTRNAVVVEKLWTAITETRDIDEAMLLCYKATMNKLVNTGLIVNPQTVDVYNSLVIKTKK
jgi:predicted HD superfamily hydrolase involved in NAD metabolism